MGQSVSEQIMSVINQMAEKLGVAAEKIYPILKRQAILDGYLYLAIFIIGILGLAIVTKQIRRIYEKQDSIDCSILTFYMVLLIVLGIIFAIFVIINLLTLKDTCTALFNPDWYIFNNILKQLVK